MFEMCSTFETVTEQQTQLCAIIFILTFTKRKGLVGSWYLPCTYRNFCFKPKHIHQCRFIRVYDVRML
jgi:hypothetical protein